MTQAIDAWTYALDRGRPYFAAPPTREAPNVFLDDAKQLGAVTRAMHEALAGDDDDPDLAPEPASPDDLDRWAHRTQQAVRDSLALLARQLASPDFPKERAAEAEALVRRGDHYAGWINEIADHVGDDLGMLVRAHGDLHLGRVLRSDDGEFVVIESGGNAAPPAGERREKTSPLRDVAGMLRSFAYAAATLAASVAKDVQPHVRELRNGRWERDVRAAYVSGYLGDGEGEDILPDEEAHVHQLITLFETEKVFNELAHELNNRPTSAWIPMRGIAKLATKV